MNAKLSMIAVLPVFVGCGFAYGAGAGVVYEDAYSEPYYYESTHPGGRYARGADFARLPVPRSYVPAPGRCRVWLPGVAPGRQPHSGSCRVMERRVPPGGWLLVRPYDYPQVVELIALDAQRPGIRTRRVYDVRSRRRVNGYRF